MVSYLSRAAWDARPARSGPGELTASRVTGVVIHWPGTESRTPIRSQAAVAAALRSWQTFHMDDRGWSDIAYQVAVDQAGRAWLLRGFRIQSAANGDAVLNNRYGAILLVLVQGEEPSAAMKATVRELVGHFRKIYPGATTVLPHSAVRPDGTDCPGPGARAALERGDFTPGTPQEDEVNAADIEAIAARVYDLLEPRLQAYTADLKKFERQTDAPDAQRAGDAAEREILRPENIDKIATAVVAKLKAAGAA